MGMKGDAIQEQTLDMKSTLSLHGKTVVHAVEPVVIDGKTFKARIDTGATRSSISKNIVENLGLGPVIAQVHVRNAHGKSSRDVIIVTVVIAGRTMKMKFNVSDREHMQYPILIGRNILKRGFLVDCSK